MPGAPVLTAAAMHAAEQAACDRGIPPYDLMERAGAAAADIIWRAGHKRDLLVLCGPGNNGGDGYVIARRLRERGMAVRVAALGDSLTDASCKARAGWGGPIEAFLEAAPATQIVDALFGIGLSRGLDALVAKCFDMLVRQASTSYAIDVPSGVATDSGALLSAVPLFGVTIAVGALKPAHLLHPAVGHMGRLVLADIGIEASSLIHQLAPPAIEVPGPEAHKYNRGLVAVMGGGMPGASLLASAAAAYSGAGTVRRYAADQPATGPHAIIHRRVEDIAGSGAMRDALSDRRISVVLVGPGLGRDDAGQARLDAALDAGHPLVLDADALTLLGERERERIPPGSILTPHEGEFGRLFGDLPGSKIDRALEAARLTQAIIVYKGPDSVIAAPDGRAAVANSGSPWLSTAGTGDVLAGLVAGRLAVVSDPFRAACEAVWLHGDAARRAGAAFVADDLIGRLSDAIACRLP